MWKDEIVEEVRKIRDEYAAKFNYDLDAIYKDIKEQEKQTRRKGHFFAEKTGIASGGKGFLNFNA